MESCVDPNSSSQNALRSPPSFLRTRPSAFSTEIFRSGSRRPQRRRDHSNMTFAKLVAFETPSPTSQSHSRNLLKSAFCVPHCGRHVWIVPKTEGLINLFRMTKVASIADRSHRRIDCNRSQVTSRKSFRNWDGRAMAPWTWGQEIRGSARHHHD